MVPYHNPIPEKPSPGKDDQSGMSGMLPPQRRGPVVGGPGLLGAWVQAEKMMQIVLLLPSAAFVGWLAGYGLDRWLHQTWIRVAGVIFGIIAGLVGAIRMAIFYGAESSEENDGGSGNDPGGSGGTS